MTQSFWVDDESPTHRVVVLGEDAVCSANPKRDRLEAIRAGLEGGQAVEGVVKDDLTCIPYTAITKVVFDRNDDDVEIEYEVGNEAESETLFFSSSDVRDAFAAQLAERLPDFESETKAWGPIRAAIGPITFGAVVGLLTWVLHELALTLAAGEEVSISGRRAGLKRLVFGVVDTIGPIGVLVVGGILLTSTALVLVMRIKQPPIWVTMKPARRS